MNHGTDEWVTKGCLMLFDHVISCDTLKEIRGRDTDSGDGNY